MSSDFTRIAGAVRLDIFNAWQAGEFVGDIAGHPAKWAVYEQPSDFDGDIKEVAMNLRPSYLSLRKSDAINWLIARQEALEAFFEKAEVEE